MFVKNDKNFFPPLNSYVAADIVATSMQRYAGDDYVYFNSIAAFINPDVHAISYGYD